jgi:hypothetical protein
MSKMLTVVALFAFRDALFAESALDPVLQELKDILNINMHFIGFKQVQLAATSPLCVRCEMPDC